MAAIDSAYHYYLGTYGTSTVSRYDTHKKSQLRSVYNNIVKTNKDAPLYKFVNSGDTKKFAIDIKEHTRSIQNVIAALSDSDEGLESVFYKKVAQSSDEDIVEAEYIGHGQNTDDSFQFDVEVRQIATPQVNMGAYLVSDKYDIKPGSYSFDLNTSFNSYEFQYNVGSHDTNLDVQEKIVKLINSANIGLKAELSTDKQNRNAISITSKQTGLSGNSEYIFEIMPTPDSASMKAMRTLKINQVAETAHNSSFLLNGMPQTSLSNTFTVNNEFALTLKKHNDDGAPTQIGFKANSDAIADNIQSLVNVYNNIVQLGHNYSHTQQAGKLLRDMENVTKPYYNDLEAIGLQVEDDGFISLDRSLLTDAVTAADAKDCFSLLNEFKDSLNEKASEASINPMKYVSKIIVAYKNPGHNFATPYITSIYSGMLLDQFC